MDQQSESPSLQQQWIDQRIQEAVNATLSPLQDQLSSLVEQLGRAQPQSADLQSPPVARGLGEQMRDKLDLDAHYYSGNRELWYLINSCLDERPQQVVATFYAAGGPGGSYDPQEFMRYLDRTYQDSNIQSRAAATLRTMRQREDQPLASFLPRFEQALAEAGGADWPDSAKIVFLENAINARLQESLVTAVLPDDYQGWLTERRCYRCGRKDHLIVDCPAQVVFPGEAKKDRTVTARVKQPDASNDSDSAATSSEDDESKGKTSPGAKAGAGAFKADIQDWKTFKPRMNSRPVLINARLNRGNPIRVLVDSGCDCYAVIDEAVVQKFRIPLVDSKPREIGGFSESSESVTSPGVVAVVFETAGFDERIFAYVVPSLGQDMFLGRPWMERNQVVYNAAKRQVYHGRAGVTVRLVGQEEPAKKCNAFSVQAISLADIEKALQPKPPIDTSEKAPADVLEKFRKLFSPEEAMKLPPHRPGVDHEVNLQPGKNGNEPPLPWGPLYNMSREEFSAAAAPVLFRDRYPLPLIAETLQNLAKAKWFTKLDVVAAFHKIRMARGMSRYMNSVLREWLDDFVTAYLDDVLIYSSGSKADHEAKVRQVLQEVKYLGSFLGFANYYRIFIPDYAKITQPLDALLKKGTTFRWGRTESEAFQELKRRFCESPVLKQWDPSLPTFLETDCSGYALGGVLAQEGPDGRRHACAFFSKRLSPAEYNYPIHDKEMLAIMRYLDNWSAELRSCGPFTVLTDHRNLEYFMTRQKLTERQSRWAAELSQFDFKLEYRPDDKPQGIDDEREQGRMIQLIPDSAIPSSGRARINAMSPDCSETSVLPEMKVFEEADMQQLWDETAERTRFFGLLTRQDRIWSHDSTTTGHPGREGTLAIVARRFYWPGQSQLVRRFVANCDICGRAHIWRQSKRGFLKPLPIPDRPRSHLSMDFITDLPPTGPSKARYLWVIVDRLTKAVTLEVMDTMEAEACAKRFLQCHYRFHGMPRSIDDWGDLLPAAQLALNNRESAATKISPFFVEHGYHVDPISVEDSEDPSREREESKADALLTRLQEVNEYMQAVMAAAQQRQEEAANVKRQPAERFEVDDAQPPAIQDETGEDLWDVDEILCARWKKRGRGEFRQALVRWTGYSEPTWQPVEWLKGTIAMKAFEDKNSRNPPTTAWSEGKG
ncbi:transposon Tf2-3 polyprotein [Hirsutella rhossiliensis]|uniref:RNA-directed DNA polymerase n=1 Tax=Hirsutella rhossiliensis TaxID=111463 RepID=A0A9P8SEI3_9HYPO|nr:transposon Tf2-3 polyprotein [Hirsutella rhossiliensis]KAH0959868.1 transposon Tf2-3 polyprotein [Hirsutella rhossiliensis]